MRSFIKRPSVLLVASLLMMLVVMLDSPGRAGPRGNIQGETFDTLYTAAAVAADTTAPYKVATDTTIVFDLTQCSAAALGIQSDCDSLQVTVQVSLTGFDEYASVGDTALTLTSSAVWANVAGTTWPVQVNATAGTPGIHFLRQIGQLPPDGAISSDFAITTMPAPYMRVILSNNDTANNALNTVVRVMLGN